MFKKIFLNQDELRGSPAQYFRILTDISKYYLWNPNILHASLDGPFCEGATGMSMPKEYTYTPLRVGRVISEKLVELTFKLGGGVVNVVYELKPVNDNTTYVSRKTTVTGINGFLLYLTKGKIFRKNFDLTLKALEGQVLKEKRS